MKRGFPEKNGAVQRVVPGNGKGGQYVSNLVSFAGVPR